MCQLRSTFVARAKRANKKTSSKVDNRLWTKGIHVERMEWCGLRITFTCFKHKTYEFHKKAHIS